MVFEFERVGESHGPKFGHTFDDAIVLEGRPNVPGFEGMATQCMTPHRFEVDERFGSNRSHWRFIKGVHAIHYFGCRKARV